MLDATEQAKLVRTGKASPLELADEAIARIEKINPELNAVITPLFDKARTLAAGPLPDGPFQGVPMLLKDLTCHSAGDPMYEGMRFLRDANWVEREDSYLATAFRAAGFVFMGKTKTPELGILPTTEPAIFGPTRNPWDPSRSTGLPHSSRPPNPGPTATPRSSPTSARDLTSIAALVSLYDNKAALDRR